VGMKRSVSLAASLTMIETIVGGSVVAIIVLETAAAKATSR